MNRERKRGITDKLTCRSGDKRMLLASCFLLLASCFFKIIIEVFLILSTPLYMEIVKLLYVWKFIMYNSKKCLECLSIIYNL